MKAVGHSVAICNRSTQEQPMSLSHLPERVSEALIRATGHHDSAQTRGDADHSHARPFSIAISREAGTRGPAVARAVAERLGWQVYHNALLGVVVRDTSA